MVALLAFVAVVAVVAFPKNVPLKLVAVTVPVAGTYVNPVELVVTGKIPVVAATNVIY